MLVGVVSDTHGYLNPRVTELLQGVDHILHAGDIGDDEIIRELSLIAPVSVVRGNNDREGPTSLYPLEVKGGSGWQQGLAYSRIQVAQTYRRSEDEPVARCWSGYRGLWAQPYRSSGAAGSDPLL